MQAGEGPQFRWSACAVGMCADRGAKSPAVTRHKIKRAEQLEVTAVRAAYNQQRTAVRIEIAMLKAHEPEDVAGLDANSEKMVPNVELPAVAELSCCFTYRPAMARAIKVPMATATVVPMIAFALMA